jgi:hypothetical protein
LGRIGYPGPDEGLIFTLLDLPKIHFPKNCADLGMGLILSKSSSLGVLPPMDCEVKCEVDPAYRIRKEQKGGKPTSAFPQLIHGYGARSNIFHNHFFGDNLLNIRANSTAMSSRRHGVIQNMNSMISSFSEIFSIRALLISYRIIFTKYSIHI